jgi:hypothetical protein
MRGTVALGDCLADVAVLRADPDICGLCNALNPEPRLVRHWEETHERYRKSF